MLAIKLAHLWRSWSRVTPHNLIAKILASEDRVQQRFHIRMRGMVNMQIQTAVRPQYPPHFQQPDAQPAKISRHIIAINRLGGRNHAPYFGIILDDVA